MNEDLEPVRKILNKAPAWLVVSFAVAIYYLWVLLYAALLPLTFLYGWLLRAMVWMEWEKQGKDVLVVHTDGKHSEEWTARFSPLIGDRAVLLNYGQQDHWDRWSLPAQLFEIFGPHPMPEFIRKSYLPYVVVFRELRRPKTFAFGERSKDREEKLEQLRTELSLC